jgi:hypothetical protein
MIAILIMLIIAMAVRLVYLEFTRHDQEIALEEYRTMVLEWYLYLKNKEHSDDFELWRNELSE